MIEYGNYTTADAIIRVLYEPELAEVIREDRSLPAYKQALDIAQAARDTLNVDSLRDELEKTQNELREYKEKATLGSYRTEQEISRLNDQIDNYRAGIELHKDIRREGALRYIDGVILDDVDYKRDYLDRDEFWE